MTKSSILLVALLSVAIASPADSAARTHTKGRSKAHRTAVKKTKAWNKRTPKNAGPNNPHLKEKQQKATRAEQTRIRKNIDSAPKLHRSAKTKLTRPAAKKARSLLAGLHGQKPEVNISNSHAIDILATSNATSTNRLSWQPGATQGYRVQIQVTGPGGHWKERVFVVDNPVLRKQLNKEFAQSGFREQAAVVGGPRQTRAVSAHEAARLLGASHEQIAAGLEAGYQRVRANPYVQKQ